MDVPLESKSIELQNEGIFLLRSLVVYKPVVPRRLLENSETIRRIYVSTDGSAEGMACTVHILTSKNNVKLIRASNKIGNGTPSTHELSGVYLGAHITLTMIQHLNVICPIEELANIEFFLVTDSLSTGLQLIGSAKSRMHIRLIEKICRELVQIDQCLNTELKLNKVLKFLWVPSEFMPADTNSKPVKTFIAPEVFLVGPPLFKEQDLSSHTYALFAKGKFETGKTFKFWNKNGLSECSRQHHFGDSIFVNKNFKNAARNQNTNLLPLFETQLLSTNMSL